MFTLLVVASAIAQPEISVKGGGYNISDGQNTWPDSTGQAFGVLTANQDSVDHTFWILNEGTTDLNVTDINVRSTTYDDHFSIVGTTALTISAGDSASFVIRYKPTAIGTHGRRDASPWRNWIDIISDDADEATFDFCISGAAIQEDGFDCSTGRMIFSRLGGGTDLEEWNYGDQPATRTVVNNAWAGNHDGLGLNPNDNRIYAMRYNGTTREQLYVFDQSGNPRYVGDVIGGNITAGMAAHASAGAFDNNNNLYTFHNADATTSLNKINVRSAEAELITLSDPVYIRGAIYNPTDGLLYGFSAGTTHDGLVSVDPTDGTVTFIGGDGDLTYAAMFRSTDGAVYMMSQTYSMYLVDLTDGSIEQIGTNPGWGNGTWVDGCACGEIKAEADLNITLDDNRPSYTPGSIQTYTITVKNNGPWGSYRDTVRNALPAGVTLMSWTSTTSGTAVSDNPTGSGALEDVVDISVGDSIVYTVKVVVPPGFTGNLVNTASVTASTLVADPLMANNSVTDTDVIFSAAAEQCNNGFDDDGDGEVDCFDGDCAGSSFCATHYAIGVIPECPDTPDVALFSMQLQWTSTAGEDYITPVVGDLDSDGIPEVVTVNYGNGRIYVLDGQDGSTITNIAYQGTYHEFSGGASIADIDNDGTAEVFLVTGNATGGADGGNCRQWISCFDYDGGVLIQRYRVGYGRFNLSEYSDQKWAVVQFADFDEDGTPELFIGNHVMNSATGAIIASPTVAQRNSWPRGRLPGGSFSDYMSAAYDVLPDDSCANCDGLELICGNTVYAVDLSDPANTENGITVATQMAPFGTYTDGLTSLADWDGDGEMDIIVTGYAGGMANFYVWDPRADTVIIDRTNIPNGGNGAGRASVADFDGDGENEIAIVCRNRLHLFENDGSLKWTLNSNDNSAKTSATAFDFEGDGNIEVVYRDEQNLRILDGVTGAIKNILGCTSGTRVEMPVVADVDSDGEAEICVSCGSNTRVYTSDLTPWMPTRKVWNSVHYVPTFVNDDLTIPANRQPKATTPRLDLYAAQAPITDPSGALVYPALPDFVVTFDSSTIASCDNDSTLVHVTICNDDANALLYNYPISYYDGDPTSGGTLIRTRTISISDVTIQSASCYSYSFNAPNQPIDLYIIANDDGTGNAGYPTTSILECDSANNVTYGEIGCPYDAGITKDDGEASYIPGGARTYEIVARNNGPSFTGGIVSDPLPSGISAGDVTWTATTYGGAVTTASGTMNGALQDTVDIPAGDSIVYSVTISTPDNLVGDLVNVVSISVTGDTITDNNTATDIDTVDCTFPIAGTVNSRTAGWTQIGTVVGGFAYNFSTAGGTKTFTPGSGPEAGESITTVVYNTGTGNSVSLRRHRYNSSTTYFGTISSYDNTPHAWTGLSGTAPENAPILGFMAFVDRNGNGTYDSGTDDYIRDINTLSITPDNSGELYIAFYDDGVYTDNNGLINIESSIDPITADLGTSDTTICSGDSILLDAGNSNAVSWVWSNGETTQTIQAQTAGEYSVVVTTPGGCQATDTMDLNLASVTVDLGNDTSICTDSTVVLDAGNPDAASWVWNDATNTQTNAVNSANSYSVIVTDTFGCEGFDTITVSQIALINLGIGNDTSICIGDSLVISFNQPIGLTSLWSTGSSNDSITVSTANTYSVLVTDSNGCPHHDTLVLALDALPVVDLGNDSTICPDSSLTISSVGGTSWDWSTGENTQSITVNSNGTYDVEVTDAATGCVNYDTIEVDIASVNAIVPANDTTICAGDSITLDAGNAASWLWGPGGETTQTIRITNPGTYDVQISYSGGCGFNDTIVIGNHNLPVVNLGNDTTICTGESITFSSTVPENGGQLWSIGSSAAAIICDTVGEYSIAVTDSNGCMNYDTVNLSLYAVTDVNIGNDTTICPNSSLTLTSAVGSSWTWSTTETTQSISVNTSGEYYVDIIDANNCGNSDTINISIASVNAIVPANDTTICAGDSITLDAGNAASWLWGTGGETTQTILVTDPASYSVQISYAGGCGFNDTIVIGNHSLPTVELGPDTSICSLEEITFDAGSADSWDWSTGDNGQAITVSSANEYSVEITDANGCKDRDTVNLTIDTLPVIALGNDTTICPDSSLTLTSIGGSVWTWSTLETSQSISVNSSGTYSVSVSDGNDCQSNESITVSIASAANINLGNDTAICDGQTLLLDAGNGSSWSWNTAETSQTILVSTADTFIVAVTYASGCTFSDSIEVSIDTIPVVDLGNDTAICDLTSIELDAGEGDSWSWNTGEMSQEINVSEGTYSVNLKDGNGCVGSGSITITTNSLPTINLGNDTSICFGESITLDAGLASSYNWSNSTFVQTINVNSAGTYWVDITDANDCVNRDSIVVNINAIPVVDLGGNTSICENDSVVLDAGNYNYEIWNGTDTSETFTVSSNQTVNVIVIDNAGCSGTDQIEVTVNSLPTIELGQADSAICDLSGEETNLWVVNPEGMQIEWSTGEITENITAQDSGYYWASKINEFDCSARDTVFVDRFCEEKTFTLPNVFTPNGDGTNETLVPIEPTSELLDYFSFITFTVYNRWGKIVFLSKDQLPYWNGEYLGNGRGCPSGVYYWVVDYKDVYGRNRKINGYVELLR